MMRLIDADATLETLSGLVELVTGEGAALTKALIFAALQSESIIPTVGGWISVKDRLPDCAGYECLVCAVNENYNQTHVFTAHTGYGEPGWWTGNVHYMSRTKSPYDNRLHPALKVTHWMPLPEPPKGEKPDD